MVTISVLMSVDAGDDDVFAARWRDTFLPAIRAWPGFLRCDLLAEWPRETDGARDAPRYRLDIVFASEEERQHWASSPEHEVAYGTLTAGVRVLSSMRLVPAGNG